MNVNRSFASAPSASARSGPALSAARLAPRPHAARRLPPCMSAATDDDHKIIKKLKGKVSDGTPSPSSLFALRRALL